MSFITLEDINTWIMKYIDNDEPLVHQAPLITANHSLYRGNNNPISGLITLPDDEMEYSVSYQGKTILDELYIPEDYEEDSIRLRVITKSYYPYVGVDVYIDVPVETKELESVDDLNNYSYGELGDLVIYDDVVVNDVYAINGSIKNSHLTIKGHVTLENVNISMSTITVDGTLTLRNCTLTPAGSLILLVNNNNLNIIGCESSQAQNLLLNKGTLNLTRNNFSFDSNSNYPCIHSETYPDNITRNTFTFEGDQIKGYGICIIRTNNINTSQFLSQNTTNYNCIYTNDETTYHVEGEGLAYCTIDDDTIHFTQLEVNTQ